VNNPVDQSELKDHPGQGMLLLYLAQELPPGQSREIATHLAHCWTCVAAAERLKQGIQIFMESRDTLASAHIDVPPPSVRTLRERMESSARVRGTIARYWQALPAMIPLPFSRPLQIAVFFSASFLTLLVIVTRPPNLNAAEVLRRASASVKANSNVRSGWVHRKIRIRSGPRVVDWESYSSVGKANVKQTTESTEWTRILRGPISWDDPLSISDFSEWRDRQRAVQDSVDESKDRVVVTTSSPHEGDILSSSLTVRRADWHPIAKSVAVVGQPLVEVTELVWEVRDMDSLPADRPEPAKEKSISTAPANNGGSAAPIYSNFDRELAEIRVRDALFALGVGLTGDEPGFVITSEQEAVTVEVATQSAARETVIRSALLQISGVHANVLGPDALKDAATNEGAPLTAASGVVSSHNWTQPLMWDSLVTKSGNAQAAAEYSGRVLTSAGKVRALVAQAHGLSARYPPEVCRTLPADVQSQVDLLVAKVMHSLARSSQEYGDLLASGFDKPASMPHPLEALSWQNRADLLFDLVSDRDRLLAKLFAVTDPSKDSALTPEQALRDFAALNERIEVLSAGETR
jgi:hypothetical protein